MINSLDKLTLRGFKSIRELEDFELKNLNILIGANGAGKSNLIAFFQMLKAQADGALKSYITLNGGIEDLLYKGREPASKMELAACFGSGLYRLSIVPGVGESYEVIESAPFSNAEARHGDQIDSARDNSARDSEALAVGEEGESYSNEHILKMVHESIRAWKIYHFHDTSTSAAMRHSEIVEDDKYLRHDASNIAPYLLRLREEKPFAYGKILFACQLVAPFIEDFILEPKQLGPKTKVSLTWKAKGSDYPMQAYHLSDGTIRFICLATALLQPNLPPMIILDEPDLSLHPEAIHILSELIESAARKIQVVVTTQSPLLLDEFAIEDIVVVKRDDRQSGFERLKHEDFNVWLEEYSVGELWTMNVIQGDLAHEPGCQCL